MCVQNAYSTWHGYVNVSGGVVSYWECSRRSWREGPEAYTYQVPAYRHSIVRIRTCLYVPGTCLTHTFPTRQGGEDFHAWAHDDHSGQSPIHFEWTLSAFSPGCWLFNIFLAVYCCCWLVLMCVLYAQLCFNRFPRLYSLVHRDLMIVSAMSSPLSIKTFHQFLWQFASLDVCLASASVFDQVV